jgi:hypothetical protein
MSRTGASLVICAFLFLQACGSLRDQSAAISPGDSKEAVLRSMGTPDDRQFQGNLEAWQYGAVTTIGVCEYTVIWLVNAKVVGMNAYRNPSSMGCRAGLRTIRWEDAPTASLEIRNR